MRHTAARRAKHLKRRTPAPPSAEGRALLKLILCAAVFVLLVAVKLLFPQQIGALAGSAHRLIGRDADFRAAFAAVGRAVSGEEAVSDSLQDAYAAVFGPGEEVPRSVAAPTSAEVKAILDPGARFLRSAWEPLPAPGGEAEPVPREEVVVVEEPVALVSAAPPLPEDASLEQRNLGFAHVSPLVGTLTSPFGWREHPVLGGTRFHYGVDLAAEEGTDVLAFADGEVFATGESSDLGNYILLDHPGGYRTLYAHCSRVTALGGQVSAGEKIAEVGQTGMATGPHLHFQLQDGDLCLNPIYYVELG